MEMSHGSGADASLFEYSRNAKVFCSFNSGVTSLPAYSAKALGPIIYNGATQNPQLKAVLIGLSVAVTTASGAAVSIGLAWGTTILPAATTASTLITCTYANGL